MENGLALSKMEFQCCLWVYFIHIIYKFLTLQLFTSLFWGLECRVDCRLVGLKLVYFRTFKGTRHLW